MSRPLPVAITVLALTLLLLTTPLGATEPEPPIGDWLVTIETGRFGPVETVLRVEGTASALDVRSLSGALEQIRALPGADRDELTLSEALLSLRLDRTEEDGQGGTSWSGSTEAPSRGHEAELRLEGSTLLGSIEGGPLAGVLRGERTTETGPLRDYPSLVRRLDQIVSAQLFDPDDLEEPAYALFRDRLEAIATVATDDLDLLFGFRLAWTNDPFSHFELRRSPIPVEDLIESFDNYRVGRAAARLEQLGDGVALLTVDTMMGNDTIEQIRAAYEEIARLEPRALIVDLRGNGGGAFAVKPLVEHLIDEPFDAGYFLSKRWNDRSEALPTATELARVAPWEGWSIGAFWRAVQEEGLLRIRFMPAEPNFDGPVLVLLDRHSASAAELAADALKASGVAMLIGERTAGQMLSQSMFDVAEGFMVSLPVADYYSVAHGRIEGDGVAVDLEAESGEALERARALLGESE